MCIGIFNGYDGSTKNNGWSNSTGEHVLKNYLMKQSCFHCSDEIIGKEIKFDDKVFCCNGCKSVYQLLSSNSLDSFYSIENNFFVVSSK